MPLPQSKTVSSSHWLPVKSGLRTPYPHRGSQTTLLYSKAPWDLPAASLTYIAGTNSHLFKIQGPERKLDLEDIAGDPSLLEQREYCRHSPPAAVAAAHMRLHLSSCALGLEAWHHQGNRTVSHSPAGCFACPPGSCSSSWRAMTTVYQAAAPGYPARPLTPPLLVKLVLGPLDFHIPDLTTGVDPSR